VGRDGHVTEVPQRVVRRERFRVGDVEAGAGDGVRANRRDERVGVDDGAAADIDEVRVGRERLELGLADQALGLVGQRRGDDEVIGPGQRLVDGVLVEADDLVGRAALLGRVADADSVHVEPVESLDDGPADGPETDDGDDAVPEFACLEVAPLSALLALAGDVHVAGEAQNVSQHLLGDVGRVDA